MDKNSLKYIVCPITKTSLVFDEKNHSLVSKKAQLSFPIKEGIPVMILDNSISIRLLDKIIKKNNTHL